jgi:hypothetical protein
MSFIESFIKTLRTAEYSDPGSARRAACMADSLESRYTNPKGDGFDIPLTGDDEKDREALAVWLDQCANEGAYLGPPWGRSFSEETAVILRHRLECEYMDYEIALALARHARDRHYRQLLWKQKKDA